jgi:signal peptidase I
MKFNLSKKTIGRAVKITGDIFYFVTFGLLIFCISSYLITWKTTGTPNVLGYRHFYIASESMEPTILKHQFVLTEITNPDEVQIGDIIAYKNDALSKIIIHRVTNIREENGQRIFTFQGDNNDYEDPYDVFENMIMYKIIWY